MVIKKYIAIGIKLNNNYVTDVIIRNNNSYGNSNSISMNYTVDTLKCVSNDFAMDYKEFDSKKEVINHIFTNLKYNSDYTSVIYWTHQKIYVEVHDLLEQRRYKIKKIVKKLNKKKKLSQL